MAHQYKLSLEYLKDAKGEEVKDNSLSFTFENHDNLFAILNSQKDKLLFENEQQQKEFIIGLKLFSEVMMKNRNNPLFTELLPAFGDFMKKLKGKK